LGDGLGGGLLGADLELGEAEGEEIEAEGGEAVLGGVGDALGGAFFFQAERSGGGGVQFAADAAQKDKRRDLGVVASAIESFAEIVDLRAGGKSIEGGKAIAQGDDLVFKDDGDGAGIGVDQKLGAGPHAMLSGTNVAQGQPFAKQNAALVRQKAYGSRVAAPDKVQDRDDGDGPQKDEEPHPESGHWTTPDGVAAVTGGMPTHNSVISKSEEVIPTFRSAASMAAFSALAKASLLSAPGCKIC
jgi:hypothetical protein